MHVMLFDHKVQALIDWTDFMEPILSRLIMCNPISCDFKSKMEKDIAGDFISTGIVGSLYGYICWKFSLGIKFLQIFANCIKLVNIDSS